MSDFPIYREVAEIITADPSLAYSLNLDQLEPVISLNLLDPDIHKIVLDIIKERTKPKPIPIPKPRRRPVGEQQSNPRPVQSITKPRRRPAGEQLQPQPQSQSQPQSKPRPVPVPRRRPAAKQPQPQSKPKPIPAPRRRSAGERPVPRPRPVKSIPAAAKQMSDIEILLLDHRKAAEMSTEQLKNILLWSDQKYYNANDDSDFGEEDLLSDAVYDYVKRMYHERTGNKGSMKSITSATGVGAKPRRERDVRLPFYMGSLDNLFNGQGDVDKWVRSSKARSPYFISAKMDGTSALYHDGHLYTRGDGRNGRDISHVLKYIRLPDVNYTVRGEIVMDRDIFIKKHKNKNRKVNRNSVAGALGAINHIDPKFLSDLDFVAYEIIMDSNPQIPPSEQFKQLQNDGFQVAHNFTASTVNDSMLSQKYNHLLKHYRYHIDGLVICSDHPYKRLDDKNPDYAKAFKEALQQDTAVTEIVDIEWNPTQYGYLMPTVVYQPVNIGGITLERATAHTARDVRDKGLGIGAKIEVIYWGSVNPQINQVLKPATPSFPTIPYEWIINDDGEEVNIKLMEDHLDATDPDNPIHKVRIAQIHRFLTEIGVKGLGEIMIGKIYTQSDLHTVGSFINMKKADVAFLGPTVSTNIISNINRRLKAIDVPTLMAASRSFGRGLGVKKFKKVFETYPSFMSKRHTLSEYIELFMNVEGFAQKTSELAAEGMIEFLKFIDNEIPSDIMAVILENTTEKMPNADANLAIKGKNICITGFRDQLISDFITRNDGKVQSAVTGKTDLVVIKDSSYTNTKTSKAEANGISIITKEEFLSTYMS